MITLWRKVSLVPRVVRQADAHHAVHECRRWHGARRPQEVAAAQLGPRSCCCCSVGSTITPADHRGASRHHCARHRLAAGGDRIPRVLQHPARPVVPRRGLAGDGLVRGDVIALGFVRTTVMEMGEPPPLESARRRFIHESEMGTDTLRARNRRYFADSTDLDPRVYWRLTDNWLELAVRFVTPERGVRAVKDAMSPEIYWPASTVPASAMATFPSISIAPSVSRPSASRRRKCRRRTISRA